MQRPLFEGRFYETYRFANVVRNVLHDRFAYLRMLDEFYGEDGCLRYIRPFPRNSAFHGFIEFIVTEILCDEIGGIQLDIRQDTLNNFINLPAALDDLRPTSLPINEALNYYGIEHTSFTDWLKERGKDFFEATDDDVSDYYSDLELEEPYDLLVEKAVQEVFFVLFQNRRLLLLFNDMMASQIAGICLDDNSDGDSAYFAAPGILKRVAIPSWVKRAVYFRDRGFCTICHCDLSGILSISNLEHYDHIVPLAQGGLNDVSNIQLLCQDCNLKKSGRKATTSDIYEAWYPLNGESNA